jgi:galactose mutarotase-like enzyme
LPFEEITISHGDVQATIAPARGALVSSLQIGDKQLLYLDRATFDDPTKNVRGGIPVLFPYAGKLENGVLRVVGTQMGQHGFGRNRPWEVKERKPWRLRMALLPEESDQAVYPFHFFAEQTCTILPFGLEVELCIFNNGEQPMPVSPGWHPYFNCPGPEKSNVKSGVAAVDQTQFSNEREFDFGVVAPPNGRANFRIPDIGSLTLSFSPQMRHLQFWSQPGKDFICIEPFTGPNNTINTERRIDIPPGHARTFWMKIELE